MQRNPMSQLINILECDIGLHLQKLEGLETNADLADSYSKISSLMIDRYNIEQNLGDNFPAIEYAKDIVFYAEQAYKKSPTEEYKWNVANSYIILGEAYYRHSSYDFLFSAIDSFKTALDMNPGEELESLAEQHINLCDVYILDQNLISLRNARADDNESLRYISYEVMKENFERMNHESLSELEIAERNIINNVELELEYERRFDRAMWYYDKHHSNKISDNTLYDSAVDLIQDAEDYIIKINYTLALVKINQAINSFIELEKQPARNIKVFEEKPSQKIIAWNLLSEISSLINVNSSINKSFAKSVAGLESQLKKCNKLYEDKNYDRAIPKLENTLEKVKSCLKKSKLPKKQSAQKTEKKVKRKKRSKKNISRPIVDESAKKFKLSDFDSEQFVVDFLSEKGCFLSNNDIDNLSDVLNNVFHIYGDFEITIPTLYFIEEKLAELLSQVVVDKIYIEIPCPFKLGFFSLSSCYLRTLSVQGHAWTEDNIILEVSQILSEQGEAPMSIALS